MRHFRFTMTPEEGGFSTTDERIGSTPGVAREAMLSLDLLQDGTAVVIYLLEGDVEALSDSLEAAPEVRSFHPFNTDREQFHVHVHFEPDDLLLVLLEFSQRFRIVIEPPLEFVDGGRSFRLDIGGIQELVQEAASEFPDDVEVTVEQIGAYDPSRNSLLGSLTGRQREVLRVAIDQGYYDIPRRATHEDLAARLDCSAGTVGEHLRKVEARVLSSLVR